MLFLSYWELNENMPDAERMGIARKLTSSGLFPPEGVTVVRWDETPDGWGMLLFEADTPLAATIALGVWRMAGAGFFKTTKTAPAYPVDAESLNQWAECSKAVNAS